MWRTPAMSSLVLRLTRGGTTRIQSLNFTSSSVLQSQLPNFNIPKTTPHLQDKDYQKGANEKVDNDLQDSQKSRIGRNLSGKQKLEFLIKTLLELKDNKEEVYGVLDAWVAWEQKFPIGLLKRALLVLEEQHQWHRIIQVIKWMLSKGQGNTMRTYGQLIKALDMDHRAKEAHEFWEKKIGRDLHSVPWQECKIMISIYYRNNMLGELVKLFRGLERFDRKPPVKSIVRKVADAYETLGMLEDKERILQKYSDLFLDTNEGGFKKSGNASSKKKKKSGKTKDQSNSNPGTRISDVSSETT